MKPPASPAPDINRLTAEQLDACAKPAEAETELQAGKTVDARTALKELRKQQ